MNTGDTLLISLGKLGLFSEIILVHRFDRICLVRIFVYTCIIHICIFPKKNNKKLEKILCFLFFRCGYSGVKKGNVN